MFEKITQWILFVIAILLITIGLIHQGVSSSWVMYTVIAINLLNVTLAFAVFQSTRLIDSKVSWIIVIFLLPLLGAISYFIFGRPYKEKEARKKALKVNNNELLNHEQWVESKKFFKNNRSTTSQLIQNISKRPLYTNTTFEYLQDGVEKMKHALHDLREAKHYIHIMYFIIKDSEIWREMETILIEKARQGIEVKILIDGAGSIRFPKKSIHLLRKNNVDIRWFKKIKFITNEVNYRNHRKMIIIDGKVAYTGGINIGDEYMHKSEKFGYWRDSAIKLKGSAIRSLQLIFLMDWRNSTRINLSPAKYLKMIKPVQNEPGDNVIVADDGPGIGTHVFMTTMVKAIAKATDKVWITTPYLILPHEIESALKNAANSGVDVRIIIPGKPDKRYVHYASKLEAMNLTQEGIKIYIYDQNFIHAKQMVIDKKVVIGTSNFDKRSFTQNYELFLFIQSRKLLKTLENEFEKDFKRSALMKVDNEDEMRLTDGMKKLLIKLVSPLF